MHTFMYIFIHMWKTWKRIEKKKKYFFLINNISEMRRD